MHFVAVVLGGKRDDVAPHGCDPTGSAPPVLKGRFPLKVSVNLATSPTVANMRARLIAARFRSLAGSARVL